MYVCGKIMTRPVYGPANVSYSLTGLLVRNYVNIASVIWLKKRYGDHNDYPPAQAYGDGYYLERNH